MTVDDRFSEDLRERRTEQLLGKRNAPVTGPVSDWATDFSHLEPEWAADPYPIQDELRQKCPIAHTDRFGGGWLPTRYEDVAAIAYDTENFTSRSVVMSNFRPPKEIEPVGGIPPISSDPPFHHDARKLLLPAFTKTAVAKLEPATRAYCHSLIDAFEGRDVVDAAVAAGVAVAGPRGTVLVAGVSEVGAERPRLHVAVAAGPGFTGGELRSASTRRAPYVQLIDVAPTALALLGLPPPPSVAGQRWQATPGPRAQPLPAHVAALVDLDRAAQEQRRLVPPFFALLVGAQAVLYLLAFTVLRRLERGRHRDRVLDATRVAALAFAAAPVATYLAQLVPWWRHSHPLAVLLAAVAAADVVVVAVALTGPWRHRLLGPAGAVAGVTFAVLGLDVLTGARLQMSSLAGYSPLVAGRFAGFGNVSYAVFATGALLLAAALAAGRSRRGALLTVATVGTLAVVLDGSPTWGSDFGGVIALVPAFTVLGLLLTGARLSWGRLAAATAAGVVVVAGFALVDYARPPDARTHVGRFVGQLLHGGAATIVRRKAESNLHLLTTSVLTLLVPVAVAFLGAVLRWPTSGLRRAFAHEPALRAGLLSVLVLGVVGFLVNDSGVAVPALAMSVAIPIAIAVSLSARGRPWPRPPGPPRPATPAGPAVHAPRC
jgi:hypothetical protein